MKKSRFFRSGRALLALALLGAATFTAAPVMAKEGAEPAPALATSGATDGQEQVIALLKDMDSRNSQELRQIKREIAAMGQKMEEPGLREIIGGIGYILGLFGVAAYVASRKKNTSGR